MNRRFRRVRESLGSVIHADASRLPGNDGARRARTADLLGAIQALSQLSYSPAGGQFSELPAAFGAAVASLRAPALIRSAMSFDCSRSTQPSSNSIHGYASGRSARSSPSACRGQRVLDDLVLDAGGVELPLDAPARMPADLHPHVGAAVQLHGHASRCPYDTPVRAVVLDESGRPESGRRRAGRRRASRFASSPAGSAAPISRSSSPSSPEPCSGTRSSPRRRTDAGRAAPPPSRAASASAAAPGTSRPARRSRRRRSGRAGSPSASTRTAGSSSPPSSTTLRGPWSSRWPASCAGPSGSARPRARRRQRLRRPALRRRAGAARRRRVRGRRRSAPRGPRAGRARRRRRALRARRRRRRALEAVEPGGTILVFADAGPLPADPVYRKELTVAGSRSATPESMRAAGPAPGARPAGAVGAPAGALRRGARPVPPPRGAEGRVRPVKALRFHGPGDVRLEDVPTREPGPGDVLVEIEVALTDGTDMKAFRRGHPCCSAIRRSPFGHEFCGIDTRPAGASSPPTRRRAASARAAAATRRPLCERLYPLLNGAYAELLVVPERIARVNLHPVPRSARARDRGADRAARVLPARHRGAASSRADRGDPRRGPDRADALRVRRGRRRAAGRRRRPRRSGARWRPLFGAVPGDGRGADVVIEAVGTAQAWSDAMELVRPGGTVPLLRRARGAVDTYRLHYEELTAPRRVPPHAADRAGRARVPRHRRAPVGAADHAPGRPRRRPGAVRRPAARPLKAAVRPRPRTASGPARARRAAASRSTSTQRMPRDSASAIACGFSRCAARMPRHEAFAGSRRMKSR